MKPYLLREISFGWRESASTGSLSSASHCANWIFPSIFRRLAAVQGVGRSGRIASPRNLDLFPDYYPKPDKLQGRVFIYRTGPLRRFLSRPDKLR
jgi:hypothetical protein